MSLSATRMLTNNIASIIELGGIKMKRFLTLGLCAAALTFSVGGVAEAQFGGLLRDALPSVKLPNILGGKQPISTSIKDATFSDPSRDGFDPGAARPMTDLARSDKGGFVLEEGYFSMVAQSYCLRAGTYGPTGGDGYLLSLIHI